MAPTGIVVLSQFKKIIPLSELQEGCPKSFEAPSILQSKSKGNTCYFFHG
jgi:hypothetical protein